MVRTLRYDIADEKTPIEQQIEKIGAQVKAINRSTFDQTPGLASHVAEIEGKEAGLLQTLRQAVDVDYRAAAGSLVEIAHRYDQDELGWTGFLAEISGERATVAAGIGKLKGVMAHMDEVWNGDAAGAYQTEIRPALQGKIDDLEKLNRRIAEFDGYEAVKLAKQHTVASNGKSR